MKRDRALSCFILWRGALLGTRNNMYHNTIYKWRTLLYWNVGLCSFCHLLLRPCTVSLQDHPSYVCNSYARIQTSWIDISYRWPETENADTVHQSQNECNEWMTRGLGKTCENGINHEIWIDPNLRRSWSQIVRKLVYLGSCHFTCCIFQEWMSVVYSTKNWFPWSHFIWFN